MKNIANIIMQILTYSDTSGNTDNPQMRNFDWNRRLVDLSIDNPYHKELILAPGEEKTIFDGLRTNTLDDTSVLSLENIDQSIYKVQVTAGTLPGWREARTIASLGDVNVTINNDAVATFDFVGATLTGVIVGDVIRVAGEETYDSQPYQFNPINAGLWKVIAVSGSTVQAVRPTGQPFSGFNDSVTGATSDQIKIYSSSGVQPGDKFEIKGAFSSASYRVYEVKDVTSDTIYFCSGMPLPEESGVAYPDPVVNGHSVIVYSGAKTVFYLETDQELVVRFDDDTSDNVRVCPIETANPDLIGFMSKYGPTYKVVIKNKSINSANILYFVAE